MANDSAWIGDGDVQIYFVNNDEDEDEVMESFRRRTSQGIISTEKMYRKGNDNAVDDDEGFLCFKVVLKHHKAKNKSTKPVFFVSCKDKTTFTNVLEVVAPHVNADASTSVFMTEDFYGIRANQSGASIFMKYGKHFELHTGIHLNRVGWHPKN